MVMGKTYAKSIFREIKQSFGRFAAITGIVLLGVGFLVGLLSTTPDMEISADKYYDDSRMMDIFVKATMGLTEEDIEVIAALPGVETVMPAYVTDAVAKAGSEQLNTRIYGLPLETNSGSMLNRLTLIEGRMPQKEGECVVQEAFGAWTAPPIGTKLQLLQEETGEDDLTERFSTLEYTVVGVVKNPFYFTSDKERTTIGNGKIDTAIYIPQECYLLEVYTDFYLTLTDAKALNTFTEEYEELSKQYVKQIETIAEERCEIRYADILGEAEEALADAQKELDDGQKEADEKLAEGWQELMDARQQLDDGWKELEDGRLEFQTEIAKAQREIADAEKQLADAAVELEDGEKELEKGWKELRAGERKLEEGYKEFREGEKEYLAGLKQYQEGKAQLEAAWAEIQAGQKEMADARKQLEDGEKQLQQSEAAMEGIVVATMGSIGYNVSDIDEALALLEDPSEMGDLREDLDQAITNADENIAKMKAIKADLEQKIAETEDPTQKAFLELELQTIEYALEEAEKVRDELPTGSDVINEAASTLRSAKEEIDSAKEQLEDGRKQLEEGEAKLQQGIEEYNKGKAELDASYPLLVEAGAQIEAGRAELDAARDQLFEGMEELEKGEEELKEGRKEYEDGLKELEDAKITLAQEKAKAEKELADGEQELIDGEKEYEDGLKEYEEGKLEAEEELADGRRKLADARQELAELEPAEWYVLDRGSNVTYAAFKLNVRKVADVSKVFPVFFFLVSALVTLTTMTRMVEEERTQIGTLKALGYSEWNILLKYLIYCGLATVIGCVAGVLIGFRLLPMIINNAYTTMFNLPPLITRLNWTYVLLSCVTETVCTLFATYSVCHQSMKEKPALLMLPQAPKAGQRIFLERVKILWKHLSFSWKATVRNIFRYKKHLIMTVIGIGGCTALMLTGFGIMDSISSIAITQFEKIWLFDMRIEVSEEPYDDTLSDFLTQHAYMPVYNESGVLRTGDDEHTATVFVPQNAGQPKNFMYLHDRVNDTPVEFDEYSVLLTEKLADKLNLSVGDTFQLENGEEQRADFTITGITENYAGAYVYIGSEVYRDNYEEVTPNLLLIKSGIPKEEQDSTARKLLTSGNVSNVEFHSQTKSSYDHLLESLSYIVVLLIVAAGALAVIVLYNLTNININERMKELATLRVLGYYHKEVAAYIFREISILSVLGTLFGLFVGFWLHRYVVFCAETVEMMFGREISIPSFVWSAVLTLVFSAFVNVLMLPKIKKIDMTESMKAVD